MNYEYEVPIGACIYRSCVYMYFVWLLMLYLYTVSLCIEKVCLLAKVLFRFVLFVSLFFFRYILSVFCDCDISHAFVFLFVSSVSNGTGP